MAHTPRLARAARALLAAGLGALLAMALSVGAPAHAATATASWTIDSRWDGGATMTVTVRNDADTTLRQWEVALTFPSGTVPSSVWNAEMSGSGDTRTFAPVDSNATVAPGASVSFGLVTDGTGEPTDCAINGVPCDEGYAPGDGNGGEPDDPGDPGGEEPESPEAGTPVERYGHLSVCGDDLCDENGRPVQLTGMSSHGLQWFDHCLTEGSLDALAGDWNADVLRIAMYVQEGGYETDPRGFTDRVHALIDEATERGMYAVVDWHTLDPGDPNANIDAAKTFFAEIAERHADKPNVLYEIANEPHGVSWSEIKSYAEEVIPVIREADPDSVAIVGTRGWSSLGVSEGADHQEILADPVQDDNVMYTFHFYAASHGEDYLATLAEAARELPIFVTEFGTQEYTGDGPNDFAMSQEYLELMAEERISWTNWNYADDHRSGAVFREGTCDAGGPWTGTTALKPAGEWIRERLRNGV